MLWDAPVTLCHTLDHLSTSPAMTLPAWRVLAALLARSGAGAGASPAITADDFAWRLGLRRSTLAMAIRVLVDHGAVQVCAGEVSLGDDLDLEDLFWGLLYPETQPAQASG